MHQPPDKSVLKKISEFLNTEHVWFARISRLIWILVGAIIIGIPSYIYLVINNPYNLFGELPSLTQVENPENDLSSEVISADGVPLGRYFRYNRSQLRYDQLPPHLVNTLLVSEDHRFLDHAGMDFTSYVRVAYGIITLNLQGGGSTLSQQTAKNLFQTRGEELQGRIGKQWRPADLFISKTKEWIIAVRLERNLTKEEIIALYLNTVPFNHNAFGIKIASETYFNKRVKDLSLEECALLVGMLQSPHVFNPVRHPDRALRKRNEVIRKLYRHGYINTEKDYDSIRTIPLNLKFTIQSHNEGLATHFRSIIKTDLHRWCKEHGYDLYESGLKIHVTIDSRLQQYAEDAMKTHMQKLQREFDHEWGNQNPWVDNEGRELPDFLERKIKRTDQYKCLVKKYENQEDSIRIGLHEKKRMKIFTWHGERDTLFSTIDSLRYYNRFLHTGMMAMNPHSGEIKAWVGGINHKYFKYDHVYQAKRQPGSTFKAFVFGKAIEDGYSPCYVMNDISPAIRVNGKIYQPTNSNGTHGDGSPHTLRSALAKSLNTVTMQLMDKLKPANVAEFATRLGIKSKLDPVYSLGLGTSDVSLFEMVAAYSGFVNLGIYTEPFYISRIEDRHGNVLETFTPKRNQVVDERTAYKMVYMLKGGVEEDGGSLRALSPEVIDDNEVGGKTGTTNNASDGWYIGITHNLVTGVWVGGIERSIHFPSWKMGAGGRSAMPMWDLFMKKVYQSHEGYHKGDFKKPGKPVDLNDLNCSTPDSPENDFEIVN
jgi:penicillin-binding protein 1A